MRIINRKFASGAGYSSGKQVEQNRGVVNRGKGGANIVKKPFLQIGDKKVNRFAFDLDGTLIDKRFNLNEGVADFFYCVFKNVENPQFIVCTGSPVYRVRAFKALLEQTIQEKYGEKIKVQVNYTTYASNEDLYAKLKSGASGYDVIIPSDYMIAKLIEETLKQRYEGVKNEKGTYYTNDYRIQFVFEVDGHKKYIDMNAMKAYETDDFIKVKNLYKNKKPIEGYVYYSESGNIAYLSKTETNKTDFVFKQTKVVFIIMIVSVILFVLPLWIPYVIDILSTYKKEKGLSEN